MSRRRSPTVDLPAGPFAKAKVPSPRKPGQSSPEKPRAQRGARKPSGPSSAPETAGGNTSSLASSILPTAVVARPDAAHKLKDSTPASNTAARAAARASSKRFISSGQTAAASFKGHYGGGEGKPVKSTLAIGQVPLEKIVGSQALSHADEASSPMWEILRAKSTKEQDAEKIEGEPSDLFTPERRWMLLLSLSGGDRLSIVCTPPMEKSSLLYHFDLCILSCPSLSVGKGCRLSLALTLKQIFSKARTALEGLIEKSQHDDDSGSDDSEHFDLTHLETPAARPIFTATPDIIKVFPLH